MKRIAGIIVFAITLVGCQADKVRVIWIAPEPPTQAVATPSGFAVSPAQAYKTAATSRRLSLKHIWHIYADDRNYYIIDSFLGSSAREALRNGVVIDGQTGKMKN